MKKILILLSVLSIFLTIPVSGRDLYTKDFVNVSVESFNTFINLSNEHYLVFIGIVNIEPTDELYTELSGEVATNLFVAELYYEYENLLVAATEVPKTGNRGYNKNLIAFTITKEFYDENNLTWFPGTFEEAYSVKLKPKPNLFNTVSDTASVPPIKAVQNRHGTDAIDDDTDFREVSSSIIRGGLFSDNPSLIQNDIESILRLRLIEIQNSWNTDDVTTNDIILIRENQNIVTLTNSGIAYLNDVDNFFRNSLFSLFPISFSDSGVEYRPFGYNEKDLANRSNIENTKAYDVLAEAATKISVPFDLFTTLLIGIGFSGVILFFYRNATNDRNALLIIWLYIMLTCVKVGLIDTLIIAIPVGIMIFGLLFSKVLMRGS